MKEYWKNLTQQERLMLGIGGVMCALYLFYMLVYAPLVGKVYDNAALLQEKRETLKWIQEFKQIKPHDHRKELEDNDLLTMLTSEIKKTQLDQYPYELQQAASGDIQIAFSKVPFNAFINWLQMLNNKFVFNIRTLSATPDEIPGVVRLMVIIHSGRN